jgi:hypothetical protein
MENPIIIDAPEPGSLAEQIIGQGEPVSAEMAAEAVREAFATPLRQVVGSCFATAPAILIQREQPTRFLLDLKELIATDALKRTFGGVEYSVPLSPAPNLLRAWEYTLASMSETKANFSKWNLYVSLGIHPSHAGGLGETVMQMAQAELDRCNLALQDLHHRLELGQEVREEYLRMERRAKQVAELPRIFVEKMSELIPRYYAEVYDPDLVKQGLYEDSPAGFRLLYKHGRTNPTLWTRIYSADQFIEYLIDFLRVCEVEIEGTSHLVTELILQVQRPEFLAGCQARVEKKEGTPWCYISGGSMETFLSCYFERDVPFTKRERRVENPLDLCLFLLETLKDIPDPGHALLMESPGHAFTLLPQLRPFRDGWHDAGNSYTWVREYIIRPQEQFYAEQGPAPAEELLTLHPYTDARDLPKALERLSHQLNRSIPMPKKVPRRISALQLQSLCGGSIPETRAAMRKLGLCHPGPLLFADTNWENSYFGFVLDPVTNELDLWRCDPDGLSGVPMTSWRHLFSSQTWLIYTNPSEYRFTENQS